MAKSFKEIPISAIKFFAKPHQNKWFHWEDVINSFWARNIDQEYQKDGTLHWITEELSSIQDEGGVYVITWGKSQRVHPSTKEVKYIGETSNFKRRMDQFGCSAGLWGEPESGHSGAWRWPNGWSKKLYIAFFIVEDEQNHLAKGKRCWLEAQGLEMYRLENQEILPQVNQKGKERVKFE